MPIKIPDNLPATGILQQENIFIMGEQRAFQQDIRPLRILILNLMPIKTTTETQLLRLLSNSPLQLEISFLHLQSHTAKNTSASHLAAFYQTFADIKNKKFDGLLITGAPVGHLTFEEVDYWEELTDILDWKQQHVTSTLHICWGAQAALYHCYGVKKVALPEKLSGVYAHTVTKPNTQLLQGFDDIFYAPHSRHMTTLRADIEQIEELEILAESDEAGIYALASKDRRQVFVSGHSEYDRYTLKEEYIRDTKRGLAVPLPKNYFPNDDPTATPLQIWRAHANLLFTNWLNYYVYQVTPFEL